MSCVCRCEWKLQLVRLCKERIVSEDSENRLEREALNSRASRGVEGRRGKTQTLTGLMFNLMFIQEPGYREDGERERERERERESNIKISTQGSG